MWFGAAVFYLFSAGPATTSREMQELIGAKNFEYFSVAIGQIVTARFFGLYAVCSVMALVYLVAEWLYLGKYARRGWLGLVAGLGLLGLVQGSWLQPRLKQLHRIQWTRPQQREAAVRAYHAWQVVSSGTNLIMVIGLGVYLWRVANPPDSTRFVSTTKFRS